MMTSRRFHALVYVALCGLLWRCGPTAPSHPPTAPVSFDAVAPTDDAVTDPAPTDVTPDPTPDVIPGDTSPPPEDTVTPPEDTSPPPEDISPPEDIAVPPEDITVPPDEGATPPLEVRFIAIGDTGEGNDSQYEVADAMKAKCDADGCDFAVLLGDNVYDAGVSSVVDQQWEDKFELPYAEFDMPFYAVLGNHDNGGLLSAIFGDTFGGAGAEFDRGDIQVAYTDISDKWTMPDRTYDWVAGPAHFFALDTNDMMWAPAIDEAADRANAQTLTFPGLIDGSGAHWKIVLGHHPYLSNGAHGNAGSYEGLDEDVMSLASAIPFLGDILDGVGEVANGAEVKSALEQILCDRVDLYLSGHDHNRQWHELTAACPGVHFIVSGAGSKVKDLEGSNPVAYEDADTPGFLWVHIQGKNLYAEFIDMNGVVNFSRSLSK